ncbi:MAG: GtrA family protein [Hyphomicrobiales bacterium]
MKTQFLRFLITGGIAAIINLSSRYVLNLFITFEIAIVFAYLIGMLSAYILARIFVFDTTGRSVASELQRFAIVNVFALVLVWFVSVGFARFIFPAINFNWHSNDIAHFIGVMVPAITSYFAHRFFTFSKK